MNTRELLAFICEDPTDEVSTIITRWVTESKRFHDFAVNNRAKIRKKLCGAPIPEELRSVLLELEVARRFVADRRCLVEYEKYGQGRVRGPDLTVTFRTRTILNLEVTNPRNAGAETSEWEAKLINLVCHKLGQMIPASLNVLVVASESDSLTIEEVAKSMKRLKEQVEQREGDMQSRFGFATPSGFFKQFQRLSGIMVWNHQGHEMGEGNKLWLNRAALPPLPDAIASLLTA